MNSIHAMQSVIGDGIEKITVTAVSLEENSADDEVRYLYEVWTALTEHR
jgi:hypothetical protein